MLKLEKLALGKKVTLSIKNRSIIDGAFLKALLWSTIFHLVVLCSFRIKMFDIPESSPVYPIAVSLENDPQDSHETFVQIDSDSSSQLFTDYLKEHTLHEEVYEKILYALLDRSNSGFSPPPTLSILPTAIATPIDFEFQNVVYPLKIKLSNNLKACHIVDDGMRLFDEKKTKEFLPHTRPHYTIKYRVSIDGTTGKIASYRRSRELLDKSLQTVADRMLDVLVFWTPAQRKYTGELTLTFYCNGEEIVELLQK